MGFSRVSSDGNRRRNIRIQVRTEKRRMPILQKTYSAPSGRSLTPQPTLTAALLVALAAAFATSLGCARATSGAAPPPLQVQVVAVEQKDVPVLREWIGTLDGLVNADI